MRGRQHTAVIILGILALIMTGGLACSNSDQAGGNAPVVTPDSATVIAYLNQLRALAGIAAVQGNSDWHTGIVNHCKYMVKNDYFGHAEDPSSQYYTASGDEAGRSCNLAISANIYTEYQTTLDNWITRPFHAVQMLDPELLESEYGQYTERTGDFYYAAGLDVERGLGTPTEAVSYPKMWPGDGTVMKYRTYNGGDSPDPLASCTDFTAPTGMPIYLFIGDGTQVPDVTAASLATGGANLEICIFDETDYENSDPTLQAIGRDILNARDAIVIIPKDPLQLNTSYRVSVTEGGNVHEWGFTVSTSAVPIP